MEMKQISSQNKLCLCCMEEHMLQTVRVKEHTTFKNVPVDYEAEYLYCDEAKELYAEEDMICRNDIAMKDAYRRAKGLLTSDEISAIRKKYRISQKDLCLLLGWGAKTITRYESHQVQDRAHDTILRKLEQDPEWFLILLSGARKLLPETSYDRYFTTATNLYECERDSYLRKAVRARYAGMVNNLTMQGNTSLSLDKVVDVIRYFASSSEITNLYKVKLMKLLWYSDALSYKKRNQAITGLAYQALPMGAVPIAHESIIDLKGVPCEEIEMGEALAYRFYMPERPEFPSLCEEEKKILDIVIHKLGRMTKDEIISFMHEERAYRETEPRDVISFTYAKDLQI